MVNGRPVFWYTFCMRPNFPSECAELVKQSSKATKSPIWTFVRLQTGNYGVCKLWLSHRGHFLLGESKPRREALERNTKPGFVWAFTQETIIMTLYARTTSRKSEWSLRTTPIGGKITVHNKHTKLQWEEHNWLLLCKRREGSHVSHYWRRANTERKLGTS